MVNNENDVFECYRMLICYNENSNINYKELSGKCYDNISDINNVLKCNTFIAECVAVELLHDAVQYKFDTGKMEFSFITRTKIIVKKTKNGYVVISISNDDICIRKGNTYKFTYRVEV